MRPITMVLLLFTLMVLALTVSQIRVAKLGDRVQLLEEKAGASTKEKGYSWIDVTGTPPRIYLVSFGGDTTWYKMETK